MVVCLFALPVKLSECVCMQGRVYHWTISTGYSLAEAVNLYVGDTPQLVQCAGEWLALCEAAMAEVSQLLTFHW